MYLLHVSVALAFILLPVVKLQGPNVQHFFLGGKNRPICIALYLEARFALSRTIDTVKENAPEFKAIGAANQLKSLCGSDVSSPVLILSLYSTRFGEELKFMFKNAGTKNLYMAITAFIDPLVHFENATDSPFAMDNSFDLPIGERNMSFKCASEKKIVFNQNPGYSMTMIINYLQIQAYDLQDASFTFSPEIICDEDKPLTLPTKEPFTTVQPIPRYVVNDGDKVCMIIQGRIAIKIPYQKKNEKNLNQTILVPANAKAYESRCTVDGNITTQEFKLIFFNATWSLLVEIAQDKVILDQSDTQTSPSTEVIFYSWKKIQLQYILDDHFIKPISKGLQITLIKDGIRRLRASSHGSYKCNSEEILDLGEGVKMELSNFQYRAFGTSNSTDFTDSDVAECQSTDHGNNNDDTKTVQDGIIIVVTVAGFIFLLSLMICLKKNMSLCSIVVVNSNRSQSGYITL